MQISYHDFRTLGYFRIGFTKLFYLPWGLQNHTSYPIFGDDIPSLLAITLSTNSQEPILRLNAYRNCRNKIYDRII